MQVREHPSLWVREAPAAPPEPGTRPPAAADVAVVGGGIAGISIALHLARAGVEVVVLEAGAVASRASGRNDGQLLLGLGEHYNRIVGQFGERDARRLWQFIRANNEGLKAELRAGVPECDLVDGGGLRLAQTEHEARELAEAAALLEAEGIPHRLWSEADVAARLPLVGFHGALELPGEAIVQPVRMVQGLARLAAAAGARVHQGCPVAALGRDQGPWTLALAGGGSLRAAVVVLCTSALALELDPTGFLRRLVFPFRGQVLATDPLPADAVAPFAPYAMSSNFCYEYFRVHQRRFVVGGMRWSVKGQEEHTIDDAVVNPEVTRNLLGYVERHFPTLRGAGFPHAWTGIMAGTPDGLPLVGALPGSEGLFTCIAFNGYGLSFAYEAGRLVRDQVLQGRAEHPSAGLFLPRRFA
jgi:gamma-glutamylputrescine oxidase